MEILNENKTSMNYWARMIKNKIDANNCYANALLEEEYNKESRLIYLSNTIGLPVYNTFHFILPEEMHKLMSLCNESLNDGWKLSLRLMDSKNEQLLFRNLDVDTKDVLSATERLSSIDVINASIRPYKTPTISGTLLINHSDVLLEIVFGPHNWLTKSPPLGFTIYNCKYCFPHLSVKYSIEDTNLRGTLYRILQDVIMIVFGLSLRQLSEVDNSVYAEFIWLEDLGYKFYECSFSDVWTDVKVNM